MFIATLKTKLYRLLRWSEKWMKTDMVYLAKGGSWLMVGQIISVFLSLFLYVAFANLLSKETYGIYKYVLSVAGILSVSALSGMGTAITQAVARGYEGSIITALKKRIKWGIVGSLFCFVLFLYYYLNDNNILALSFIITSFFIPFFDSFSLYDAYLKGKKLFGLSTKYSIISLFISTIAIVTIIFFTKNLFLIILIYFFSWTLPRILFFKKTLKDLPANQNKDPETISYGKHLTLIDILSTFAAKFDSIIIFHFLGPIQLAIYSFATIVPERIKTILGLIQTLIFPVFSKKNKEELKNAVKHKSKIYGIIIFIAISLYFFLSPYIYKLFFPQYLSAVNLSKIYSLSLIGALIFIPNTALQSQKETKKLYITNTIPSIVRILLLFVLTVYFGIIGTITAIVIYRIFLTLFYYRIFYK